MVKIEYFAQFRSCARISSEVIFTVSISVLELFDLLREKYRFPLDMNSVGAVVNEDYADWNSMLQNGDRVVFIPPISGG